MRFSILDRPKVFSVGFQCSGTKLLRSTLKTLDYSVVGGFGARRPRIRKHYAKQCIDWSYNGDAFVGDPWPMAYRQMDQLWPNAKFILTVCDPETWLRDLQATVGARTNAVQRLTLGQADLYEDEAALLARFETHEKDVRAHFRNQPDRLLVVDLTQADGVSEIADFLEPEQAAVAPRLRRIDSVFRAATPQLVDPFPMALAGE